MTDRRLEPPQDEHDDSGDAQGDSAPVFREETTNEYDVSSAFEGSSARAEISMDAPEAVEDTRELEVPRSARPRRQTREIPEEVREQWERKGRVAGRFRRWFYSDPVVIWFYMLPRKTRRTLTWAAWILFTCATTAAVFTTSALGLYPIIEEYVRPAFAPRPESPVRLTPRPGMAFDFVEERDLDADEFRLATDCLWIVPEPSTGWEIDEAGVTLEKDGETVAELDIRYNWDGLVRLYFGAGEIPVGEDLHVRIALREGGMWPTRKGQGYALYVQGGNLPPSYVIGPIRFVE
jgi:hypothetical protein